MVIWGLDESHQDPPWRYEDRVLAALRALFWPSVSIYSTSLKPPSRLVIRCSVFHLPPASKLWINSAIHFVLLVLASSRYSTTLSALGFSEPNLLNIFFASHGKYSQFLILMPRVPQVTTHHGSATHPRVSLSQERESAIDYIFNRMVAMAVGHWRPENSATSIPRPLSDALPTLDNITAKAASEAARYTAVCNYLDDIMKSAIVRAADIATPKPHPLPASLPPPTTEPHTHDQLVVFWILQGSFISLKRVLHYWIEWLGRMWRNIQLIYSSLRRKIWILNRMVPRHERQSSIFHLPLKWKKEKKVVVEHIQHDIKYSTTISLGTRVAK